MGVYRGWYLEVNMGKIVAMLHFAQLSIEMEFWARHHGS